MKSPRILFLDIETFAIEAYTWGIWDVNIGLNQIKQDWTVASWAAKWADEDTVMYQDVSKQKNRRDDRKILLGIWDLLNQADIIVTQNGKAFDAKKLNARFVISGMKPPAPYRHIDTKQLAKKSFGFTSNSLEYMANALGTSYKKLKHKKFPGFDLWTECLKGNREAWAEMKKYNIHDVLALEAVYQKIRAWHNPIDMRVYSDAKRPVCATCGSEHMQRRGHEFTKTGKFRRYACCDCGAWMSERGQKNNLLSKKKRASLQGRNR